MLMTKRKPASVGEILSEEFPEPMGLTQRALAEMGVQRKYVNEQRPSQRNLSDRAHPCPRVRQQRRFLAERAAAQRSLGSDALASRTRADRTCSTADSSRMTRVLLGRRRSGRQFGWL